MINSPVSIEVKIKMLKDLKIEQRDSLMAVVGSKKQQQKRPFSLKVQFLVAHNLAQQKHSN